MNPLASELNKVIESENPIALKQLSQFGKEIFFPKGILTQTAEAKEKASKYNATIGTAMGDEGPLSLASFEKYHQGLSPAEVFNYAPSPGKPGLRKAWKERMLKFNPSLQGQSISMPVVTSGLTHGLSLTADLFFDQGDVLILPDQIWGNYNLTFKARRGVSVEQFPFYKDGRLNQEGLRATLDKVTGMGKAIKVLFNFPNNPTGYALYQDEVESLKELVLGYAEKGEQILLIFDDAYFGLFFEDAIFPESLFTLFQNTHENIMAVKLDGVTKEYFAWGYRVGFITFGCRALTEKGYLALEKKAGGAIRGTISNCSMVAQSIVEKEIASESIEEEAKKNFLILKARGNKVQQVLKANDFSDQFTPYPFNAGYFMLINLIHVEAETLRLHLLHQHGIGTIATAKHDLRIAFSCVEERDIEDLFKIIHRACGELV